MDQRLFRFLLPPLGPGDDHVDIVRSALPADKPLAPVGDGCISTIALRLCRGIGLDLMAAIEAPHDEPHTCLRVAAKCHRRRRISANVVGCLGRR